MTRNLLKNLFRVTRSRQNGRTDLLRDPEENRQMAMDGYILGFYAQTTR